MMKKWKQLVIVSIIAMIGRNVYVLVKEGQKYGTPPTTQELVDKYGYTLETHKVQTEDGYTLTLHRIPGKSGGKSKGPLPVIFLQHGFACNSALWVAVDPEVSIGFYLADRGYDVWMGNSRGNEYSIEHNVYDSSDPKFWDFSWHEMGVYDLPASVDYVLKETGQKKIQLLGYSMGTTIGVVMLSEKPEYNDKISHFVAIAPIIYIHKMTSRAFRWLAVPYSSFVTKLGNRNWFGSMERLQRIKTMLYRFCQPDLSTSVMCDFLYQFSFGPTSDEDRYAPSIFYGPSLSSTSVKTIAHFSQMHLDGKFRPWTNGKDDVQEYSLQLVTSPISILYSENDHTTAEEDVIKTYKSFSNVTLHKVQLPTLNHVDFMLKRGAKHANNVVFKKLEERR